MRRSGVLTLARVCAYVRACVAERRVKVLAFNFMKRIVFVI